MDDMHYTSQYVQHLEADVIGQKAVVNGRGGGRERGISLLSLRGNH